VPGRAADSFFNGGNDDDEDAGDEPFVDDDDAPRAAARDGAWIACYRGFHPGSEALPALVGLVAACGEPTGLEAVTPVAWGEAQAEDGPSERLAFRARAGRCYRIFAVGDDGVEDLDVAVLDPDGRLAAADVSRDRFPVVPPRGPLCAEREGVYTIEIAVAKGRGGWALQVFGD
jgi:hypothetical protein